MYLDFSKLKHVAKTYKEKQFTFSQLFKFISPSLSVDQLHRGEVLQHLQEQASDRSGYAANKQRKNLVAAWNWGCKYIPNFPVKNPFLIDRFPEIRHERYIPPESDFWKVFDCAESDQDKVMLISYLHLAARRAEIFNLRVEDIDFVHQQLKLYTRKRQDGSLEYDWLPITDRLFDMIQSHLVTLTGLWVYPDPRTGLPYATRQKWLPRLCKLAGVKPFGLHSIRHLSASILIQGDVSLIDVQTILRHKKLTTTEKYVHRLQSVRSAMNVFK